MCVIAQQLKYKHIEGVQGGLNNKKNKGWLEPNACFFKISIFSFFKSLKCTLHIASYALRMGVSVMEL